MNYKKICLNEFQNEIDAYEHVDFSVDTYVEQTNKTTFT
jgi:hypothetical protein